MSAQTGVPNGPSASVHAHTAIPTATSRVAVVTHLLSASRQERAWDVVMATVFDALESGPKPAHELATAVQAQWPGSNVNDTTLGVALDHATSRGLLREVTSLYGRTWELSDIVKHEAEQARLVAETLVAHARSTLASDARRLLKQCPDDQQVQLWFELLLEAIDVGLRPFADRWRRNEGWWCSACASPH